MASDDATSIADRLVRRAVAQSELFDEMVRASDPDLPPAEDEILALILNELRGARGRQVARGAE